MAFGFPAYHTERRSADPAGIFLLDAVEQTLDTLSWKHSRVSDREISARVGVGLRSWGETMRIVLEPGNEFAVTSKCGLVTQCFDWGKNKENVRQFLAELGKRVTIT